MSETIDDVILHGYNNLAKRKKSIFNIKRICNKFILKYKVRTLKEKNY